MTGFMDRKPSTHESKTEDQLLEEIEAKTFINVGHPEIKAIKEAVEKFLRKICQVEYLKAFGIEDIVPNGSVPENARLWGFMDNEPFVEFDYLAVMSQSGMDFEDCGICPGFKHVRAKTGHRFKRKLYFDKEKDRGALDSSAFLISFQKCLITILAACKATKNEYINLQVSRSANDNSHKRSGGDFSHFGDSGETTDFDTICTNFGNLILDLSYPLKRFTLKFTWTSWRNLVQPPIVSKILGANEFSVYVDFLPAFMFRNNDDDDDDDDDSATCIVPLKCRENNHTLCWKESTFLKEREMILSASALHLKAYKLLKFFLTTKERVVWKPTSYMMKTVFLYHIQDHKCRLFDGSVKGCLHAMLKRMSKMCYDKCIPNFFNQRNLIDLTYCTANKITDVGNIIATIEHVLSNADSKFKNGYSLQKLIILISGQYSIPRNTGCNAVSNFNEESCLLEVLGVKCEKPDVPCTMGTDFHVVSVVNTCEQETVRELFGAKCENPDVPCTIGTDLHVLHGVNRDEQETVRKRFRKQPQNKYCIIL